jgi:hypothetical protein
MQIDSQGLIRAVTGAQMISAPEYIQSLWSGYGSISRYQLTGAAYPSLVVKHVSTPARTDHPHGWNTDISHLRKLKSYQVETAWYRDFAVRSNAACRVPQCYAVESLGDEVFLLLEDLDASGFDQRRTQVTHTELQLCVAWLAEFHATFMQSTASGLWQQGTYWHLATRPDELEVLVREDPALHAVAGVIDQALQAARFKTLVHGDAKLANFCFSRHAAAVAAVDFQYVGEGCGMQDLIYLMGSCLSERECELQQSGILNYYFETLVTALNANASDVDTAALESEWRHLYPFAWTDFQRFLKGWSPGHWKVNDYSEKLAQQVVAQITEEQKCN